MCHDQDVIKGHSINERLEALYGVVVDVAVGVRF